MNHAAARELVAPFYNALTLPSQKDVGALVRSVARDDWRSYSNEGVSKGREELIAMVEGFGKLIPDLTWTIKDVLVDGERIVVRGEAAGTPAGPFFGTPHTGRSFRIMSIDIHTVKDGKLAVAHHVEDWAGALGQLTAK